MSAFAAAMATIFADRNMALDAFYFEAGSGEGIPVRVMRTQPDVSTEWSGSRFVSDSDVLHVRVAAVPDLDIGDRFLISGQMFEVMGEPVRDAERLVWQADVAPAVAREV